MQQLLFPKFQDKILMMANGDLRTKQRSYKNPEENDTGKYGRQISRYLKKNKPQTINQGGEN